jgi:hypothetical protein
MVTVANQYGIDTMVLTPTCIGWLLLYLAATQPIFQRTGVKQRQVQYLQQARMDDKSPNFLFFQFRLLFMNILSRTHLINGMSVVSEYGFDRPAMDNH